MHRAKGQSCLAIDSAIRTYVGLVSSLCDRDTHITFSRLRDYGHSEYNTDVDRRSCSVARLIDNRMCGCFTLDTYKSVNIN